MAGSAGVVTLGGGSDGGTGESEGVGETMAARLDLPEQPEGSVSTGGEEECASYTDMAMNTRLPANIVVVVDNSGSMEFEAAAVQDNLNAFSQQIINSGVDVRVVLLSAYPEEEYGMCIEPPLGSGGCPDEDNNPPLFTHIDQEIDSHDALEQVLDHHDEWSTVLLPDAALHFMIVTDDESDLDADTFHEELLALDSGYADYKLNGIVCITDCDEAADIGETYIELGALTGGLIGDLCDQDFQPVFDLLATQVVAGAQISCVWAIPDPPAGETFDPARVNVEFDDGMGGGFPIGFVESEADCGAVVDGWYYDDPVAPTLIVACPQTCEKIQGVEVASIAITLGCATEPAFPIG